MNQVYNVVLFVLLNFLVAGCNDWPREKKVLSNKYYFIREERGTAFSSTVFDYEFYESRWWWWDRRLGSIVYRNETPADSVGLFNSSLSGHKRVLMIRDSIIVLDSSINFEEEFDINTGLEY